MLEANERTPLTGETQDSAVAIQLAALYVQAAQQDRSIQHETDPLSLKRIEAYYSFTSHIMISLAFMTLILLTLFEHNPKLQLSGHIVELFALLVFLFSCFRKIQFSKDFYQDRVQLALIVVLTGDALVSWSLGNSYFRYCRILRPTLYFYYDRQALKVTIDLFETVYRVKGAMLLLLFHILFFTLIGVALFHDSAEGREHFGSVPDAYVNLIVLLSTCNSPDIYMPVYEGTHFSALYFVVYVLIGIFLLLNLVLAVVYFNYRRQLKRETHRRLLFIRSCLHLAFRTLELAEYSSVPENHISYAQMQKLFRKLGFDNERSQLYCKLLDSKENKNLKIISEEEFNDAIYLLNLKLVLPASSKADKRCKKLVRSFLEYRVTFADGWNVNFADLIVDLMIFANGFATLWLMVSDIDEFILSRTTAYQYWGYALQVLFIVEVACKGWTLPYFFQNPWNKIDIIAILTSGIGVMISFYELGTSSTLIPREYVQALLLARQLRVLRVMYRLRHIRFYVEVVTGLVPALRVFFIVIFSLFYTYAIVGMGLFHEIKISDYTANGFDTFDSALVTLFELMIVNDWHKTMNAYVNATNNRICRIYFIVWYFCMVIIIMNSITSFVVEAVDMQLRKYLKDQSEKRNDVSFESYGRLPRRHSILFQHNTFSNLGMEYEPLRQGLTMDRLLNRIFDNELDEPTIEEIDDYLEMLDIV